MTAGGPAALPLQARSFPGLTTPLARLAARCGDGVAAIDGARRLTWSQLLARIEALAGALQADGLVPGDHVALLSRNSARMMEAIYGTLWAGGVACPLNTRLAEGDLRAQLAEAEPVILFFDDAAAETALAIRDAAPSLRQLVHLSDGPHPAGTQGHDTYLARSVRVPDVGRRGDDTAMLIYSGGTTGRSKGVMLSHGNFWANAMNVQFALRPDATSTYLQVSPMFHVSAVARMFASVINGAAQVFIPQFRPDLVLSEIARNRVAVTTLVPTMLRTLVEHLRRQESDIGSLRIISYGASPIDETLVRRMVEAFPKVDFWQAYGMTELSPTATQLGPEWHRPGPGGMARLRSAGLPATLAEVMIGDPGDSPMPAGETGEVLVRGPMVMKGYWKNPRLTAEALRNGWMHTGDLGYRDAEGFLYIVDRKDDMIISGGENIHSLEVENAIAAHPAVAQCAVVGVSDPHWGQRVHAVVVPRPGQAPSLEELQAHCRTLIAGFKVPRSLELRDDALPLSGINKVLKTELRRQAEARQAGAVDGTGAE